MNNMGIRRRDVLFPIFLECCKFTKDSFWENVFEDLSYGKAPYGTYISKGFLCCGYRKKEFSYKIERKDPKVVYTEVYNLLSNKRGLLSPNERIKQKKLFDTIAHTTHLSRTSWSNIRKKSVKELLIELFVIDSKNKFNLSWKQAQSLLSILSMAKIFKIITRSNIHYKKSRITSIDGISFKMNRVILDSNLKKLSWNTNKVTNVVTEPKINKMSDTWGKYLKEFKT